MQAKQTGVIWAVVIATLVLLVAGYIGVNAIVNNTPSADEVAAKVIIPAVNVPTADEIASKINVDVPEYDDSLLLEGVYPAQVNMLRNRCINNLANEFDQDDVLDDLEELLEDEVGEPIVDLQVTDWNYKNDYKFKVINLGLDDRADREGSLTTTLRVTYELEDGNGETIRTRAFLYAYCGDYDKTDNEFDELSYKVTL